MPHRDPETGQFVGGSGGGGSSDYTSFEYEHHRVLASLDGPGSTGSATVVYEVDPLEDFGGLESDEVAELVATYATVDADDDVGVSGSTPAKIGWGVSFGVDLAESETLDEPGAGSDDVGEFGTNDPNFDGDSGASALSLRARTEAGLLYQVGGTVVSPMVDTTNGVGLGPAGDTVQVFRPYRSLLGRGPVLDRNDALTWWVFAVIEDVAQDLHVRIRQTSVWDVSTVEGTRRQFSVP